MKKDNTEKHPCGLYLRGGEPLGTKIINIEVFRVHITPEKLNDFIIEITKSLTPHGIDEPESNDVEWKFSKEGF